MSGAQSVQAGALWGIDVPIRAPRFQQNMVIFVHGFIGFVFV